MPQTGSRSRRWASLGEGKPRKIICDQSKTACLFILHQTLVVCKLQRRFCRTGCVSLFPGQSSFAFLESVGCRVPRNEVAWGAGFPHPQHRTLAVLFVCGGKELLLAELLSMHQTSACYVTSGADTTGWLAQSINLTFPALDRCPVTQFWPIREKWTFVEERLFS